MRFQLEREEQVSYLNKHEYSSFVLVIGLEQFWNVPSTIFHAHFSYGAEV